MTLRIAVSIALLCGLVSRAADAPPDSVLSDEYVFEVLRHVYRWHMDDTMLPTDSAELLEIDVWVKTLSPSLDPGDKSRYLQVVLPDMGLEIQLKKADYYVAELDARIRNSDFKIVGVRQFNWAC